MIITLEKIVGILPTKCEPFEEFIKRVNEYGKESHASRIEIVELHHNVTAILYRKYGLDDNPSKESGSQ